LWFEEGSPFLTRLSTELGDIPHKITPLLWSGANSIFVRDKTAHVLAEYLSAEHIEHPQAAQLVIAHSHGGNIALRALYHLRKLNGSQFVNPFVVTLATPFIEAHEAIFGSRASYVRLALVFAVMCLCMWSWIKVDSALHFDLGDLDYVPFIFISWVSLLVGGGGRLYGGLLPDRSGSMR
jgi:hypothetical protein